MQATSTRYLKRLPFKSESAVSCTTTIRFATIIACVVQFTISVMITVWWILDGPCVLPVAQMFFAQEFCDLTIDIIRENITLQ